jgi:hypothetical protein
VSGSLKLRLYRSVAVGIALSSFSIFCAWLLYEIVQPLRFIGSHAEFDPMALLDSTIVITGVAFICWTLHYLLGPKQPTLALTAIACLTSWGFLAGLFVAAESNFGSGVLSKGFGQEATAVLADGSDMAFMPFVIPVLAIASGLAYSAALGLSNLFVRWGRAVA